MFASAHAGLLATTASSGPSVITAIVGLTGAVIGATASVVAQWRRDVRQGRREYRAAVHLVLMDLERSRRRLASQYPSSGERPDPRGFSDLPRGAWIAHRPVLAGRLPHDVSSHLAETYNEIVEWNDIVFNAFATSRPEGAYRVDEAPLAPDAAHERLAALGSDLLARIEDDCARLAAELPRAG